MKASELTHDKPWFKYQNERFMYVGISGMGSAQAIRILPNGTYEWQTFDGRVDVVHLPNCTGWAWKEPKPVSVPTVLGEVYEVQVSWHSRVILGKCRLVGFNEDTKLLAFEQA